LQSPGKLMKLAPVTALALLPAIALTLLQNKQVTGSWTTLPYALSRYQYGVPATFTFQPNPVPHRQLTREQELDYEIQSAVHGKNVDTVRSYFERLATRVRLVRFFFPPPLYLALPAFLLTLGEFDSVWILATILMFWLGSNFYPYFYSHYIAAVACLFVLVSVKGLDRLTRIKARWLAGGDAARAVYVLCIAHFLFWYCLLALGSADLRRYQTWDAINQGDPEGRIAIQRRLDQKQGRQLVFVRYWPPHTFSEWVYNPADIDSARIVFARDLGPEENEKLIRDYGNRTVWLLEPDFRPPRLRPY